MIFNSNMERVHESSHTHMPCIIYEQHLTLSDVYHQYIKSYGAVSEELSENYGTKFLKIEIKKNKIFLKIFILIFFWLL